MSEVTLAEFQEDMRKMCLELGIPIVPQEKQPDGSAEICFFPRASMRKEEDEDGNK